MVHTKSETSSPLITSSSFAALAFGAIALFAFLLPSARERLGDALQSAPSALSLAYLELGLDHRPEDIALRLKVARKSLDAGFFDLARAHANQLAALNTDIGLEARMLLLEIDRQSFSAIDPERKAEREQAHARFVARLRALDPTRLPLREAERVAELCLFTDEPVLRARVLDALARRDLPDRETRIEAADAAYLAAEQPLEAAQLHASIAESVKPPAALRHARLAVERARSSGQIKRAQQIYTRLHQLFPDDAILMEHGLALCGDDDRRTLEITQALLAQRPNDVSLHRRVARLMEWNGNPLRAMDAYTRLWKRGGNGRDRQRALELARENWDLPLVVELSRVKSRGNLDPASLRELVAFYETLGRPDAAIGEINAALSQGDIHDPWLYYLKAALEQRSGEIDAAEATLGEIATRFEPTRELVRKRADLLLALGRTQQALALLVNVPWRATDSELRRVADLALELGDLSRARQTLHELAQRPEAIAWDVQRLYWLERSVGEPDKAMSTAIDGYERLDEPILLDLAIDIARTRDDEQGLLVLLARAEDAGSFFVRNPSYWQERTSLLQRQAAQALDRGRLQTARGKLLLAAQLLAKAEDASPKHDQGFDALWEAQQVQEFGLALASNDHDSLASLYPQQEKRLTVPQRVNLLHRLGRDQEAVTLAIDGARDETAPQDQRDGLEADANALSHELLRRAWVRGETASVAGNPYWQSAVGAEYAVNSRIGFGATVAFADHSKVVADTLEISSRRELTAQAQARYDRSTFGAGVFTPIAQGAYPFGLIEYLFVGPERRPKVVSTSNDPRLRASARVNEQARETSLLRAVAVRDELAIDLSLPFARDYFVASRASAHVWSTHDRRYLGAGAALDGGIGRNFTLPYGLGTASVRVATYIAPRFAAVEVPNDALEVESTSSVDANDALIPEGTIWIGGGASLFRGDLGLPPTAGYTFVYLLDGALGGMWPQNGIGWSTRAGAGASLIGSDQLLLSANAGNVLGAAPGNAVWGLSLEYSRSLWK